MKFWIGKFFRQFWENLEEIRMGLGPNFGPKLGPEKTLTSYVVIEVKLRGKQKSHLLLPVQNTVTLAEAGYLYSNKKCNHRHCIFPLSNYKYVSLPAWWTNKEVTLPLQSLKLQSYTPIKRCNSVPFYVL